MADDQKKNPLDILEDVLKDAKSASQAQKKTKETEAEAKEEKVLAMMREQKQAEEEILIQEQLSKMKEISQDPATQARQAQIKAEVSKERDHKSSQKGYEIRQLGHKKI